MQVSKKYLLDKFIDKLVNFCDVKYIKFQKRNPSELLSKEKYNMPHPVPANSFGKTYGLHREKLEFNIKQHKKIQSYCKKKKLSTCVQHGILLLLIN